MQNFQLAVITPIKETPQSYFEECIRSVVQLNKSLNILLEWVIVIDGDIRNIENWVSETISTDDLSYKIIRSNKCIGLGAARNLAASNTNAKYLTWLDADDLFKTKEATNFYQEGIHILEERDDVIVVYSDNLETDHNLNLKHLREKSMFHRLHLKLRNKPIDPIFLVDFIYQAQVLRRSDFLSVGGFNTDSIGEDVELILKLATNNKNKFFFHLPFSAYVYRQNLEGIVSTRYNELRKINKKTYSEYSRSAGIHDCESPLFKVLYLNPEKKILEREPSSGVFFNTFLPKDTSSIFYIDPN